MTTAVLIALVLSGGGDSLSKVTLGGLSFKAPTEWPSSSEDESSRDWTSPDEKGKLAVSVFPVDPVRPPKACVTQLVDAVGANLGKEGFTELTVGNNPASRKITTDFVCEGAEARPAAAEGADGGKPAAPPCKQKDENKVTTTTVVGCNGKTKWLVTYSAKTADSARFGPILKRVLDSITYGK